MDGFVSFQIFESYYLCELPWKSEFGDLVTILLDDNMYFMEITISFLQIKVTNWNWSGEK